MSKAKKLRIVLSHGIRPNFLEIRLFLVSYVSVTRHWKLLINTRATVAQPLLPQWENLVIGKNIL